MDFGDWPLAVVCTNLFIKPIHAVPLTRTLVEAKARIIYDGGYKSRFILIDKENNGPSSIFHLMRYHPSIQSVLYCLIFPIESRDHRLFVGSDVVCWIILSEHQGFLFHEMDNKTGKKCTR